MFTRHPARQVTSFVLRTAAFCAACVLAHVAAPAAADTTVASRQPPASILLEVPSNPNHAEPAELTVLSFEYDAAAQRLTYTRGYDSTVAGSFLIKKTDEPIPIAPNSVLRYLEIREADDDANVFRRVLFHGVRVIGITHDGNDRRLSFTAESVTVR